MLLGLALFVHQHGHGCVQQSHIVDEEKYDVWLIGIVLAEKVK